MATIDDERLLLCPNCNEIMALPIQQCLTGHSICGKCVKKNTSLTCPICNTVITNIRNIQLEQLIENIKDRVKVDCAFKCNGCTYKIKANDKMKHEKECRYNKHKCEANKFLNTECTWKGSYDDIIEHFRDNHHDNTQMSFKSKGIVKINKHRNYKNLHVIDFGNGKNIFYFKIKIDIVKRIAFFWFQMVGLENLAKNYYYEFEIYKKDTIMKMKFSNFCNSHAMSDDLIINNEICALFSFNQLKNFMNEQCEVDYRYRIMKC